MKHKAFFALTVTVLALAATVAHSQTDDLTPNPRAEKFMARRIEHRLGLSKEQVAEIKQIAVAERPAIQSLAERHRTENQQLEALPAFDEAQVRAIAVQQTATQADMLVEREKVRHEILAVLTPEQRAKAQKITATLRSRMEDRLATLGDQM